MNLFSRKKGPTFEVIRPHTAEALPLGYFKVKAGERETLGFRCSNFFAYEVKSPVNDGHKLVHLEAWLKEHNMKSVGELPTVKLNLQRAEQTQHSIEGTNIIETDSLEEFDGNVQYDGTPNSGVAWV